jgi:hypothetical protein
MGGFIEPSPVTTPDESIARPILFGIAAVVVVALLIAYAMRAKPKAPAQIPPYVANVQLSNIKMSAAQNFVGATVTYIDGTLTNAGDKTVTHAIAHVIFRDAVNQVAQAEDVPLRVLQTGGPYLDAVDLSTSPLVPGQSKPFRLTFEHVTGQWNQNYPELKITDVTLK